MDPKRASLTVDGGSHRSLLYLSGWTRTRLTSDSWEMPG